MLIWVLRACVPYLRRKLVQRFWVRSIAMDLSLAGPMVRFYRALPRETSVPARWESPLEADSTWLTVFGWVILRRSVQCVPIV